TRRHALGHTRRPFDLYAGRASRGSRLGAVALYSSSPRLQLAAATVLEREAAGGDYWRHGRLRLELVALPPRAHRASPLSTLHPGSAVAQPASRSQPAQLHGISGPPGVPADSRDWRHRNVQRALSRADGADRVDDVSARAIGRAPRRRGVARGSLVRVVADPH